LESDHEDPERGSDLPADSGLKEKHYATRYTATSSKGKAVTRSNPDLLVSNPMEKCVAITATINTQMTTAYIR
jgi:hypothetical protein